MADCPDCYGSGKNRFGRCVTCGGQGEVPVVYGPAWLWPVIVLLLVTFWTVALYIMWELML